MTVYKFIKNKDGGAAFFHKRFPNNEKPEIIDKWKNRIEKLVEKGKTKDTTETDFIIRMKLNLTHSYYINNSNINVYENEKIRFIKITSASDINYEEKVKNIEAEVEIENESKTKYILTKR